MATVTELSDPYAEFLLGPRPGRGVCGVCFNLTDGWQRCWACAHGGRCLDLVSPISYSVAGGRLHHALAAYKRTPGPEADRLRAELAAVLWRHLEIHERCLARARGRLPQFELVTTVPSSEPRARRRSSPAPARRRDRRPDQGSLPAAPAPVSRGRRAARVQPDAVRAMLRRCTARRCC